MSGPRLLDPGFQEGLDLLRRRRSEAAPSQPHVVEVDGIFLFGDAPPIDLPDRMEAEALPDASCDVDDMPSLAELVLVPALAVLGVSGLIIGLLATFGALWRSLP